MSENAIGFVWYELMTGDLDKAVEFYQTVVGWDVRDSGMPGIRYMLFGKDGKDVGGMMAWESAGMKDMPTVWKGHIQTADVDAEADAVVRDGGKIFRPAQDIPGVGRFAVVGDPQGAEFLLFQPGATYTPPRLEQNALGSVGWHELHTTDWEAAWQFYSNRYGWVKDHAVDMGPMGVYQTFKTDKPLYDGGMMNQMQKGTPPVWRYYFTVEDVDAAVDKIKAAGGQITHGPADVPGGTRILIAVDAQGGDFALVSGAK